MIRSEAGVRPHSTLYLWSCGRWTRGSSSRAPGWCWTTRSARESSGGSWPPAPSTSPAAATQGNTDIQGKGARFNFASHIWKKILGPHQHSSANMKHVQFFPPKYFRKPIRFLVLTLLNNQLEKLEAAKAAWWLVCLSLLGLTGPYSALLSLNYP